MRSLSLGVSCVVLSALAPAQTDPTSCAVNDLMLSSVNACVSGAACSHASLLAHVQVSGALAPYSLVHGFAMPVTGREFAVIGASNGLAIVDAHDLSSTIPGQPLPPFFSSFQPEDPGLVACALRTDHRGVVAYATANGALVVESNLWRPYLRVFEVTPAGTSFQVNRLADIVFPNPLPPGSVQVAPRMLVDAEQGILFVAGVGGTKMHAYDLEAYLVAGSMPPSIWQWTGGGASGPPMTSSSFDVHLFRDGVSRRLAVSAYTPAADYVTILDVSNLVRNGSGAFPFPYQPLSWAAFQPLTSTHSVWVDPTASRLYNSYSDASVDVYELSGFPYGANNTVGTPRATVQPYHRALPRLEYGTGSWLCHTTEGLGLTGYAAGWESGLQVVDLRPDCLNPNAALASLRTCAPGACAGPSPCLGSGWFGAWSVYFKQDSGVVYVSDQASGLFLVRVEAAHLHRFGRGVASVNHPTIPRLSLRAGPPRVTRPATPIMPPLIAVPQLDTTVELTVSNLQPASANLQVGVIDIAVFGDVNSTVGFDPAGVFPRYGVVTLGQVLFSTTNETETVQVPLAGAYEGLPVFLQVAIYQTTPAGDQVVATSRGSFVGIAAQRNP